MCVLLLNVDVLTDHGETLARPEENCTQTADMESLSLKEESDDLPELDDEPKMAQSKSSF